MLSDTLAPSLFWGRTHQTPNRSSVWSTAQLHCGNSFCKCFSLPGDITKPSVCVPSGKPPKTAMLSSDVPFACSTTLPAPWRETTIVVTRPPTPKDWEMIWILNSVLWQLKPEDFALNSAGLKKCTVCQKKKKKVKSLVNLFFLSWRWFLHASGQLPDLKVYNH